MLEIKQYLDRSSEEDIGSSRTLRVFVQQPRLAKKILDYTKSHIKSKSSMCDLGCGMGFLPKFFGDFVGFQEVYGIDINVERINIASERIKVRRANLENMPLPFPNNHFDFICSFGVLEHLRFFDNTLKEANRVLKEEGLFLASIPNLGDWVNRIRLLLGLQPHAVQVSQMTTSIDHIHSCTLRTFKELLKENGFIPLKTFGCRAIYRSNRILEFLDVGFSKIPSLSVRFFQFAKKRAR